MLTYKLCDVAERVITRKKPKKISDTDIIVYLTYLKKFYKNKQDELIDKCIITIQQTPREIN